LIHFGTAEHDAYTYGCIPGFCPPGYPVSIYYYSYYNYKGIFRPQNPHGATTTETVNHSAVNSPDFTTTQFNNRYAFGRVGSIQVIPGPNRFGGTMRYFWGFNARGYRFVTKDTPCCEKEYVHAWRSGMGPYGTPTGMLDQSEYLDQSVGFTYVAIVGTRYHTSLTTGGPTGSPLTRHTYQLRTTAPWTTGAIRVFNSGGAYVSTIELTGYDNRTENREFGTMSLVTPWLTNSYLTSFNPTDPVQKTGTSAFAFRMKVNFMPEPGGILLMGAGVLGLAGVYRLRRR
jgi:hypothetical protein